MSPISCGFLSTHRTWISIIWSIFQCPDMYASAIGQSPLIDGLFVRLRKKVKQEMLLQRELASLRGALDMILTASTLGSVFHTAQTTGT